MKVPHDEGLANHVSPESCGGGGNETADAFDVLTDSGGKRRHVSRQLSSEITTARVPTLLLGREGNIRRSVKRELWRDPAESENLACAEASWAIVANREIREFPGIQKLEWENPDGEFKFLPGTFNFMPSMIRKILQEVNHDRDNQNR